MYEINAQLMGSLCYLGQEFGGQELHTLLKREIDDTVMSKEMLAIPLILVALVTVWMRLVCSSDLMCCPNIFLDCLESSLN